MMKTMRIVKMNTMMNNPDLLTEILKDFRKVHDAMIRIQASWSYKDIIILHRKVKRKDIIAYFGVTSKTHKNIISQTLKKLLRLGLVSWDLTAYGWDIHPIPEEGFCDKHGYFGSWSSLACPRCNKFAR
jgi:hypothetical protein